jgi:glutathione S-transferase
MKLYTYDPAPNPRRLALFLKYKGIDIDTQQVDLMQQEQLSDEYRAINPLLTVPALVLDDGTVLTEVIGICSYLEDLNPQKPLLGATPLERAHVISWDHKLFNTVYTAVAEILRNSSRGFKDRGLPGPLDLPQIAELAERGRTRLRFDLPELDRHLASSTWVAGDNFTLADIDLLVAIDFAGWVKERIPDDCEHLKAWYERASQALA